MRRKLIDRLISLEQHAELAHASYARAPLWALLIVALELGDLQPHEAVAEGYARALGYDTLRAFRAGLAAGEVGDRHAVAVQTIKARAPDCDALAGVLIERHADELVRRRCA